MPKLGLVIEDDKGRLYFLRPEILEAAKIPKALYPDAKAALSAAKKNARPKLRVVGALKLLKTDVDAKDPKAYRELKALAVRGGAAGAEVGVKTVSTKSTIMCPW
jgi:hypothetical protein